MSDIPGFQDEIDFWTRELELTGPFAEVTRRRLTREGRRGEHPEWIGPLIEFVSAPLAATGRDRPRAVDLGCGPLGTLGAAHEDGLLDVIGVDPLAAAYESLRARFGAFHPTPLVTGGGERLADIVGPGTIDLVYARNSLDHVQDVQRVFDEVARALRPGGVFAFDVTAWEGSRESYAGLHCFDFHVHGGALHVTDRDGRDALDLTNHGLVLVALGPHETPRVAGLDSVSTPIRAVLVNSRDANEVAAAARAFVFGSRLVRAAAWLGSEGMLAHRVANEWSPALLGSQHPGWADDALSGVLSRFRAPLNGVEVDAGVLPDFAGVAPDRARVRSFDARASRFAALLAERSLPRPAPVEGSEAHAALTACAPASIHVVHLHDALWTTRDPHALIAAVERALVPGGLVLVEGPRYDGALAGWREPFGRAFDFTPAGMVCEQRGAPLTTPTRTSSELARLRVVTTRRDTVDDPLRGQRRVVRWILEVS